MGTLDELCYYCNMEKPAGALALIGESGSGKTHLVDVELAKELKDTHVIVRVSLFGINTMKGLHDAVKKHWVYSLLPIYSKQKHFKDGLVAGKKLVKALNAVIKVFNPTVGSVVDVATSFVDNVSVLPLVEDVHTKKIKKVVLVFDDLNCTTLGLTQLFGAINDYCENRKFHTIVISTGEKYDALHPTETTTIKEAKEKTIAYTVYIDLDYAKIIHRLIERRDWGKEEYRNFLLQHEKTISTLFGTDTTYRDQRGALIGKCQNLRSLITSMERFYRIYSHMTDAGIPDIQPYLCSFLAFSLAEKSGVFRDGKTSFVFTDEELHGLYPEFLPEYLFDSVREWIVLGDWDDAKFSEELSHLSPNTIPDLSSIEIDV